MLVTVLVVAVVAAVLLRIATYKAACDRWQKHLRQGQPL